MFDNQTESPDWTNSQTIVEEESSDFFFNSNNTNDPLATEIIQSSNITVDQFDSTSEINSTIAIDTNGDYLTGISTSDSVVGANTSFSGQGETIVETDDSGIPHIKADSLADGVYAQGYVQAGDRLWQMEYQRRAANGTLAEVLGEDAVEQDTAVRTLGINQSAEIAYKNLSPESKAIVDSYTAGINDYLESNPTLPPEFATLGYEPEPWQPTDTLAIVQLQIFSVGTTDGGELARFQLLEQGIAPERIEELLSSGIAGNPTILQPEDIAASDYSIAEPTPEVVAESAAIEGNILSQYESLFPNIEASNSWVVSGDRTTTGKPFLANDPHLNLQNPSVWYQSSIESPEASVIGVSIPGIPGIQNGYNRNIAWGQTSTQADTQDYYLLEETEDGSGYTYQGEIQPYEIREETIQVKDGEAVTIEVKDSVYGPVISDLAGLEQPVALQSVGLEPANGTIEAFFDISKAENWADFTTSLETVANPISNFVYADVEGNIGYIAPGKYPIRQSGHTGKYPIPGTGEFDWQGTIPSEEVPQVYNPESGYIVTANNKITPDDYPYEINGNFAPGYRAARVTELIESDDLLSIEDMAAIQYDQVSLLYRDFRPVLEQIEPNSPEAQQWRDRLLNWDGDIQPDSVEATIFEAWYVELTRLPGEEVGQDFWNEPGFLLQAFASGEYTAEDAEIALDTVVTQYGDDVPEWGEVHQASFEPLSTARKRFASSFRWRSLHG